MFCSIQVLLWKEISLEQNHINQVLKLPDIKLWLGILYTMWYFVLWHRGIAGAYIYCSITTVEDNVSIKNLLRNFNAENNR